jgi:hypothetical protein
MEDCSAGRAQIGRQVAHEYPRCRLEHVGAAVTVPAVVEQLQVQHIARPPHTQIDLAGHPSLQEPPLVAQDSGACACRLAGAADMTFDFLATLCADHSHQHTPSQPRQGEPNFENENRF